MIIHKERGRNNFPNYASHLQTAFVRSGCDAYILHQLDMFILMHGRRVPDHKNITCYSFNFCDLRSGKSGPNLCAYLLAALKKPLFFKKGLTSFALRYAFVGFTFFKGVSYFSDLPAESAKQKSLTLAFGSKTTKLYEDVRDLSSEEIRLLLKSENYDDITTAAKNEDLPLNTYCLRQLKQSISQVKERQLQFSFPGIEDQTQLFDPLTVTFKGGAKEPFVGSPYKAMGVNKINNL